VADGLFNAFIEPLTIFIKRWQKLALFLGKKKMDAQHKKIFIFLLKYQNKSLYHIARGGK